MVKGRFSLLLLFLASSLGVSSGHSAAREPDILREEGISYQNSPNRDTPLEFKEAWLRFHEDGLCQELDAEFVFSMNKMEVWVNSHNGKDYERLSSMLEPLQSSYEIELHIMHPPAQEELPDVKTPPPSFWGNSELTAYLRDSFLPHADVFSGVLLPDTKITARPIIHQQLPIPSVDAMSFGSEPSSIMYEQRLLMFARNTLEYNAKMKRYAADLPALARFAFDPAEEPDLRRRALAVCREHVEKLQNYEKKLNDNLSKALPESNQKHSKTTPEGQQMKTEVSPLDIALLLAREARNLSSSVYQFIYPQEYTVTVADLRNPPVIRSLATIQEITASFRSVIH
jgi:hypothetical protein